MPWARDWTRDGNPCSFESMQVKRFGPLGVRLTGGAGGDGEGDGPLVVVLHGFGAPGTDLVPLAGYFDTPPEVRYAFPEAPLDLSPYGFGNGRAWWMLDLEEMQRAIHHGYRPDRSRQVPEGLVEARTMLAQTLDELERRLRVPPGRLVLGGFSQGAMMACDAALTSDRALGGLVLFSGTLLAEDIWAQGMQRRSSLPIVQSHGTEDPLLPFDAAVRLRDLWRNAGATVDFLPFSGGHTIPPEALSHAAELVRDVAKG